MFDTAVKVSPLMQSKKNSYAPILHETHVIPPACYSFSALQKSKVCSTDLFAEALKLLQDLTKHMRVMCPKRMHPWSCARHMSAHTMRVCADAGQWDDLMGRV